VQSSTTSLQNGSGFVPHSHVRPLSEHGTPCIGGLAGHGPPGDPLLLPLVLPPELEPVLPLPLPLDPPLLLLVLPELEPPPSFPASPPSVNVAPPQAAMAINAKRGSVDRIVRWHGARSVPPACRRNYWI
jgi:hypothetical protein